MNEYIQDIRIILRKPTNEEVNKLANGLVFYIDGQIRGVMNIQKKVAEKWIQVDILWEN